MPPLLELEYEVTMEDVVAFALFHHHRSPSLVRRRRVMRLGLSATLVLMAAVVAAVARTPMLGLVGLGFALAFYLVFPRRYERGLRDSVQKIYTEGKNVGVLGRTRVLLDEEFIVESTPARDVRTRWSAVEGVEQTPDHLFVYLTGSTALVIPRREVPEEALTRLVEEVRQRMPAPGARPA